MSLVVLENLSLNFGERQIVRDLSLRVAHGDRVGLIGPNGSGKTTLLKLVAGNQQPDGGVVRFQKNTRVAYLPQDVAIEGGRTLLQLVVESVPGRREIEEELKDTEAELEKRAMDMNAPDYEEVMMDLGGRVGELHERLADFERLYSEHEGKRILGGLGFKEADFDRDLDEFSGGWKMRALLASLLFQRPDLLLMDEPTNHLDMPSVAWLSEFLKRYNRAFVLISHDREFLNEQIGRVVSFEPEGVRQYPGNLDRYQKQRDEERVLLENRARNVARERERLERFVAKNRAKASKATQAQSKLKQLERLDTVELHEDRAVMSFRFPPTGRTGKTVIEVNELKKSYEKHEVLKGVDLRVERGARIALLGVNGAGKTTLLRILAGEIEATSGSYEYGHKVNVGYYAQHHADTLHKRSTIYQAVAEAGEGAANQRVREVCGAMLFGDLEIDKPIGVLSGGERARVALAQLMINPGNVLLMDEPTNHLDLESSERLAESLDSFDGTLLFVSHNRAFIRSLATTIWFVEDGKVVEYPGSLDDYMAKCRLEGLDPAAAAVKEAKASKKPPGDASGNTAKQTKPKKKRSREEEKALARSVRKLEKRIAELEKSVSRLEAEIAEVEAKMATPVVYENPDAQAKASKKRAQKEAELEVAMDTWAEKQRELDALQG